MFEFLSGSERFDFVVMLLVDQVRKSWNLPSIKWIARISRMTFEKQSLTTFGTTELESSKHVQQVHQHSTLTVLYLYRCFCKLWLCSLNFVASLQTNSISFQDCVFLAPLRSFTWNTKSKLALELQRVSWSEECWWWFQTSLQTLLLCSAGQLVMRPPTLRMPVLKKCIMLDLWICPNLDDWQCQISLMLSIGHTEFWATTPITVTWMMIFKISNIESNHEWTNSCWFWNTWTSFRHDLHGCTHACRRRCPEWPAWWNSEPCLELEASFLWSNLWLVLPLGHLLKENWRPVHQTWTWSWSWSRLPLTFPTCMETERFHQCSQLGWWCWTQLWVLAKHSTRLQGILTGP